MSQFSASGNWGCKLEDGEEEEEVDYIRAGFQNFPELEPQIKSALPMSAGGR